MESRKTWPNKLVAGTELEGELYITEVERFKKSRLFRLRGSFILPYNCDADSITLIAQNTIDEQARQPEEQLPTNEEAENSSKGRKRSY